MKEHKELVLWLGSASVLMFLASLVLIPIICVRMGEDYFMPHRDKEVTLAGRHPVLRWTGLVLKNVVGLILLTAGLGMLLLPGQGLLTMILGVMLLNFPGKRALELRIIRMPGILRAINALRARAKHPPLKLPATPRSTEQVQS